MEDLEPGFVPRRSDGVRELPRDGELLLCFDKDRPGLVLNATSGEIWQLCDGRRSAGEIGRKLEQRYGLAAGALRADVAAALRKLREGGVLRSDAPSAAAPEVPDWSEVAAPREDLHDLEVAVAEFERRNGPRLGRDTRAAARTLCDGRVAVEPGCRPHGLDGLDDAPVDHPNIERAQEWLRRWPLGERQFAFLMRSFHPLVIPRRPLDESAFLGGSRCHSLEAAAMFGRMWATINCPFMTAESFVHEMAHQKLFGLGIFKESCVGLVANDPSVGYRSPVITDRPRPMTAVVHGVYAFMYVTALNLEALDAEPAGERRDRILERLAVNVKRIDQGRDELRRHLRTDAHGERFFAGFHRWLDELILRGRDLAPRGSRVVGTERREPVPVFVRTDRA